MFQKVLIANRGEIALRIVRGCRELGIKTIAVYSEADEQSLHVQLADEAICIGPAASKDSYLRPERIISAAEISDVDAIHPGYGFLAENAVFAEMCEEAKIKFIGPKSNVIRLMGDKAMAKDAARRAKVPTVPGSDGPVETEKEAVTVAQKIGYPVIIKAVAGGGGKGMRLAHNAMSFAREFDTARHEAEKAFGNGQVYIEKFIEDPRHIEFQILADEHGKVLHLGERDCSVQRRYQKLIEESPSPFLTPSLRANMGKTAVRLCESVGYQNAGTVEYLVDSRGDFYFMEMNTRIQVEHGVTEEVTDLDIVKRQIRIAMGEKLELEQKHIQFTRHAIECRINAEDPARNFAPCPGEIGLYYPPGGHGVRVDSHCYSGYRIPQHYDSMIGKVITFARTRELAIDRMYRALSEYLIRGIHTTIPFCRAIMRDPLFRQGKVTTRYVEEFLGRTPKDFYAPAHTNHPGVMTSSKLDPHADHEDLPRAGGVKPVSAIPQDEIKIANSVVASIVRLSVLEVEGVHAVGSDGFVDGLVEMLSKRESDRGVKVSDDEQNRYFIEVHVVIRFGAELAKVAEKIQQNVRAKVGHMTGNPVAKIDVIIDGVRLDNPQLHETDWHNEPHTD